MQSSRFGRLLRLSWHYLNEWWRHDCNGISESVDRPRVITHRVDDLPGRTMQTSHHQTKSGADIAYRHMRQQSQAEEVANGISHGIGFIAALVGTPFLLSHAARHGDVQFLVGTSIFSATLMILYLASTIYHLLPVGKAKRVFRVIEHAAIFLLIAGTYTPFTLGVLHGVWGWTLLGIVWSLAIAGVAMKAFGNASHSILSTVLYLLLGWVCVIALDPLFARVPTSGLLWLFAGGLSYTAGVAFFVTDSRLTYGHLVWHLFVMAGSACHFFAVLRYAG
jgi:hemolysin III